MTSSNGNAAVTWPPTELEDLQRLVDNREREATDEPLYHYEIAMLDPTGRRLPGNIKYPLTEKKAAANERAGCMYIDGRKHVIMTIRQVGGPL